MNTITRIGFCPICAKEKRPQAGQTFLAWGSTHQNYRVLETGACHHNKYGFVPHTYRLKKIIGNGDVIIEKSCSMDECGVDFKHEGKNTLYYFIKEWKTEVWKVETWNALVLLKHNQFTKEYEV